MEKYSPEYSQYTFDHYPNPIDVVINMMKYLLEGIAISIAAFVLNKKDLTLNSAIGIALTGAIILGTLDNFVGGQMSHAVRYGVGSGVGMGFGRNSSIGPIFPN